MSGLGITAGAHRLWAHRSYKATWQLRLLLTLFNTIAFEVSNCNLARNVQINVFFLYVLFLQDAVMDWARDHRVHHKYSETDADPHNAKRGFFFSHVGWLLCRKHPDVKNKGKGIDLSDLEQDPIVYYQKKYYLILMPLIAFVIPTAIPPYFWNESIKVALFVNLFRYAWTLNCTWLVNSAAHLFGHKPYDKFINPSENIGVSMLALGEGWHNYHHTFPWDYKTSELGKYSTNFTCIFIDFMAKIGWAYDLKTVPMDMIKKRVERTGDGTHEIWGWGDKDQSEDEKRNAIIINNRDKQY